MEPNHTPTPFASITLSKKDGLWFNFRGRSKMMTCDIRETEMPCWIEVRDIVNSHEALIAMIFKLRKAFYVDGTTKAVRGAFASINEEFKAIAQADKAAHLSSNEEGKV